MMSGLFLDKETMKLPANVCQARSNPPKNGSLGPLRVKWLPTDVYSCVLSTVLSIWNDTDVVVFLQNRHNFEKPVKIYN
jgi:hypothetical protein